MTRKAWPGWLLVLLLGVAPPAAAQYRAPPLKVELKESYPSPNAPGTAIPFTINPEVCAGGHQPVVSLKIFNVLVQVVAIPVLRDSAGERIETVRLRCGEHIAYWDGRYLDGRREAASGVYYYQLMVDGQRFTRKMLVQGDLRLEH